MQEELKSRNKILKRQKPSTGKLGYNKQNIQSKGKFVTEKNEVIVCLRAEVL
jgi:hypothetical protein